MLRIADFARAGLRMGLKGTASWNWTVDGEPFRIDFTLDTTDQDIPFIQFVHRTRNGDLAVQSYRIRLTRTPQPFGGFRWWFVCSRNYRKTLKLYLPLGGSRFMSRKGYGLGYASQREDRMGQAQRQVVKVYRRLEGDGNWRDGAPAKPKWMRWQTYDRLSVKLDHYNARFDGIWLGQANKLIGRTR